MQGMQGIELDSIGNTYLAKGVDGVYFLFDNGEYQLEEHLQPKEIVGKEFIAVYTYEDFAAEAERWGLSLAGLKEACKFGFSKTDAYEEYTCISLKLMDFSDIMLQDRNVIIYLEKERAFFFTSHKEKVIQMLADSAKFWRDKISLKRAIHLFLEAQIKEDEYIFDCLEKEIMELEQALITFRKRNCVSEIISLRKRLMILKRFYEQLLNTLDILEENENEIFDRKTLRALKIFSRRIERRFQGVLNLRDSVTQVRESYEAEVDIDLNTTMKLFTVVATIFLPLTLIVGWYGMNFEMPEYGWKYGYGMVILISFILILVGIVIFKKKNWF